MKFGEVEINHEDTVKKVLRDFDRNGNDMIDEDEFVHGMTRWLNEAISVTKCPDKKRAIDEYDKVKYLALLYTNVSKHKSLSQLTNLSTICGFVS